MRGRASPGLKLTHAIVLWRDLISSAIPRAREGAPGAARRQSPTQDRRFLGHKPIFGRLVLVFVRC